MTHPVEGRPLYGRDGLVGTQPGQHHARHARRADVAQSLWPVPVQLRLPEQLMLPIEVPEPRPAAGPWPSGVEPVEPPDAPAALACVARVLAETCAALGVGVPSVRWYRAAPVADGEESYQRVLGFHSFGESVIWLSVDYAGPEQLARTAAHEAVHHWQGQTRRACVDELESDEREREAQRRAEAVVPRGSVRTPRGKARDAWYEPARRRYGVSTAGTVTHPTLLPLVAVASGAS